MVWNMFYFPIYWECHHPNWLSYFSEGWPNHQIRFPFHYNHPTYGNRPMVNPPESWNKSLLRSTNHHSSLQDGAPQICERWFINHEITPMNTIVISTIKPLIRQLSYLGGPILCGIFRILQSGGTFLRHFCMNTSSLYLRFKATEMFGNGSRYRLKTPSCNSSFSQHPFTF